MSEQFVYDGPESVPPPPDPQPSEALELSEDFIDRALERFNVPDEPEPAAEPEPVEVPWTAEEGAARAQGRLDELHAGREALEQLDVQSRTLTGEQAEEVYENVVDALYSDELDVQARIEIAKQVGQVMPHKWEEFWEEWTQADPIGPHLLVQQQQAEANAQAQAGYARQLAEEEETRRTETLAAFQSAVARLSGNLQDPRTAGTELDRLPFASDHLAALVEQAPPQTPEDARLLVGLANQAAQFRGNVREEARLLLPVEEMQHRQRLHAGEDLEPFDSAAALARLEAAAVGRAIQPETRTRSEADLAHVENAKSSLLDRALGDLDAQLDADEADGRHGGLKRVL